MVVTRPGASVFVRFRFTDLVESEDGGIAVQAKRTGGRTVDDLGAQIDTYLRRLRLRPIAPSAGTYRTGSDNPGTETEITSAREVPGQ